MNLNLLLTVTAIGMLASCARPAYEQRGYASYIADQYAGRHTSSGDIYSPYNWTAAHHTLPFGTQVKVKNHVNGRAVNVTVNDRFPYYPGRVINISRAAAEYLGIPPNAMADVTVTARTIPGGMAPPPQQNYGPPPAYNSAPPPGYGAAPPPQQNYGPPPASSPPPAAKPKKISTPGRSSPPPSGLPPPPPGYDTLPSAQ
ncbi:MAG: septal ring lytic transglycosylase RlpA family protein [Verrucomicrobiaceae bacterium]|nr:septal ring lytic transglycosylase RlpA family protein [Verrucomicrobiaceae bacterium]